MAKPTYQELEQRIRELEAALGAVIDKAVDEEQDELFELAVLCNILQALAQTMDMEKLLGIVIEEVNKALLTEASGVVLYDEKKGDLYWREVRDRRRILMAHSGELRLPLDQSIAGWVFKNQKPAIVNDTSKDPRYYRGLTMRSGFDIRKVLQVPLIARENPIGVLIAMNKIGGDFSEQDATLLSSMAASIALAIDNATVYEKLKKSRDELEMLYRSSMALATTMDLDHLLEVVVTELNRAMETEAAGVLLHDERHHDLYWREVQDEQGIINPRAADLRVPLEGSVSGRVFRTGEPVIDNDPSSEPEFFKEFETRSGFVIRNELLVPLDTREATIGVLVVMNKKTGNFTVDDRHLCASLAGVVAMAVENATFFTELLGSYRELEDLNRIKSKILNHLSHELRTPLAIIRGTLATMERKMEALGVAGFERHMGRMRRHVQGLNRLEAQVESIMMTGYSWERRMISNFLDTALTLMDVQAERTPEIQHAAGVIRKWLEKTFPTRQDEPERLNIKEFCGPIFDYIQSMAQHESREVKLEIDLANTAEILIPGHVLRAVIEGLVRNAIEATPDGGLVTVNGRIKGDRYLFSVKDTGIGIPEKDQERVLEGFYSLQDTDSYSSGRPYSFNAGGKGIDLLRIRMFSELYGFKISFKSRRCKYLASSSITPPGNVASCPYCQSPEDCANSGGSEFVVNFPLADDRSLNGPAEPPSSLLDLW